MNRIWSNTYNSLETVKVTLDSVGGSIRTNVSNGQQTLVEQQQYAKEQEWYAETGETDTDLCNIENQNFRNELGTPFFCYSVRFTLCVGDVEHGNGMGMICPGGN